MIARAYLQLILKLCHFSMFSLSMTYYVNDGEKSWYNVSTKSNKVRSFITLKYFTLDLTSGSK